LLRYFRFNDPYRLLGLLALTIVLYLPYLIDLPSLVYPELRSIIIGEKIREGFSLYTDIIDIQGPLAGWFDALFNFVFRRSLLARHIFAILIIFCQAAFLNIIFNEKKAFTESSFVPSVLYMLFFLVSFDGHALTPQLLGAGVLLLALNNLFKEIEFREERNEPIFNLGLFIGIASLFVFSFFLFLFGALIILAVYSRGTLRKFMLMIFGFMMPHLLVISIYFMKDGLPDIWHSYYLPNIGFYSEKLMDNKSLWILGLIPLVYLAISFVVLNREARFTKYQSQLVQVMFLWMIFSFLQVLFTKNTRPQSYITVIPSLTFFISHFLLMIRRKRFAEINFWILIVGIATVSYLSRYDKIASINYEKLVVNNSDVNIPAGKRVVVLDENISVYKNNVLATPFFNWHLSKEIVENPEYYENVIKMHDALVNDPPDIIIDKGNLMKPFFERMPDQEKLFKKNKLGYERISN
jgi:hypothetical protein